MVARLCAQASNCFLGTINEQRRHSRTAICGNRPTGWAVTLDLHWPTAKLGERLPVSREGFLRLPSRPPRPLPWIFLPDPVPPIYGRREGNNRVERLSVSSTRRGDRMLHVESCAALLGFFWRNLGRELNRILLEFMGKHLSAERQWSGSWNIFKKIEGVGSSSNDKVVSNF